MLATSSYYLIPWHKIRKTFILMATASVVWIAILVLLEAAFIVYSHFLIILKGKKSDEVAKEGCTHTNNLSILYIVILINHVLQTRRRILCATHVTRYIMMTIFLGSINTTEDKARTHKMLGTTLINTVEDTRH
ncbi:hypothetical protein ACJX0J_039950, partial [Zea mays]